MIRVNLAKTHNYSSTGTQTAIAMDQASASLASGQANLIAKVALMLASTLLLYLYQTYNISQLRVKLAVKNDQLAQIQAEVEKFGPVTQVVDNLLKERQRLDAQLEVLQKISKKRSSKLSTIRLVQESVVEDLWLKTMRVDQNILGFRGYSRTPTSVQQIVKNLQAADFIESAINKELKLEKKGKEELNSFDIEARVKE